jgi:hypothetical protein
MILKSLSSFNARFAVRRYDASSAH